MPLAQDFDVFTPEVWTPRINRFFKMRLRAAPFFQNYSDEVAEGGDTVHIPHIADSFTATAVVSTSGDIGSTNVSDTKTDLTINKWMASAYSVADFQAAQVARKYNLKNEYAQAMGYSLAKKFDTALLAHISSLSPSVGSSASNISSTVLEQAVAIMESNSVPLDECIWLFHPYAYWKEIVQIQKYYDASSFGRPTTEAGVVPNLYGVPVLITENIGLEAGVGRYNTLIHKSAIVYALGNLPGGTPSGVRLSEKTSESLRRKFIADIAYGTVLMNAKRGVKVLSNN